MRFGAVASTSVCSNCPSVCGDRLPHGMIRRQVVSRVHSGARLDGGTGRETLDAGAVKLADARPLIAGAARGPQMAELGVIAAEHRLRRRRSSPTPTPVPTVMYAKSASPVRRSPSPFRERRTVDVGVESDRHAEALREAQPRCSVPLQPGLVVAVMNP